MFDSPFLSDGSKPLRGTVLTYTSLVIIALSLIYFVCALGWEIKTSRRKKKTKRQIMWSKLKGFKHKIVEDSRNKAKQDKLNKLFNKSTNVFSKVAPLETNKKKNKAFDITKIRKLNKEYGNKTISNEKKHGHHHHHHKHGHKDTNELLEKHDTDNLLPDLSTDSSSDLDGYSNTSSSNIGSSSSSDASSSPLSSSNSSNSSVGIGDDSERSGYESSENISFASGSDTLEQVVDTTSFALGDNADEEERTGRKKSQEIALSSSSSGISNSNSSSGDSRNNSSSRNSSSSESSSEVEEENKKKSDNNTKINSQSNVAMFEVEEDVLSEHGMDEYQYELHNDSQDNNQVETKMKKLSLLSRPNKHTKASSSSSSESDDSSSMSDSSTEKTRKAKISRRKKHNESDSSDVDILED